MAFDADSPSAADRNDGVADVFDRVVCGVGLHGAGHAAVRQVEQLRPPGGEVLLVGVVDTLLARHVRVESPMVYEWFRDQVKQALHEALELAPTARIRVVDGSTAGALLWTAGEEGASLIAVEDVPRSRLTGIMLGAITTTLLHEARCSVLVARPLADGRAAPRTIVVGVDGSNESLVAAQAAATIAGRCGGSVRAIAAAAGKPLDDDALATAGLQVERVEAPPVDALVEAAEAADLLVVGSRGLHGIRALGSVSERVAHRAPCSILVVRMPREAPLHPGAHAGPRVADVMTREVVTVGVDAPVADAARRMVEHGISSVVVVEEGGDVPVGIVTESDLAHLLARDTASTADLLATPVASVMTTPPPMVEQDASVRDLAHRFREARTLPVLAQGRLVGIVSEHDVLDLLVDEPEGGGG